MVDSSCRNFRLQMRLMRRKRTQEGLETPEISEKIPDHAHDAGKYGAHGLRLMMRAPVPEKPKRRETDDDGRRVFRYPKPRSRSGLARHYGVR